MKLVWTSDSLRDREAIARFIARDNPSAAVELDRVFVEKARRLIDFPSSGRKGRLQNSRELVVHPNYLLVYRLVDDRLEVLAVLHAAQRWP